MFLQFYDYKNLGLLSVEWVYKDNMKFQMFLLDGVDFVVSFLFLVRHGKEFALFRGLLSNFEVKYVPTHRTVPAGIHKETETDRQWLESWSEFPRGGESQQEEDRSRRDVTREHGHQR